MLKSDNHRIDHWYCVTKKTEKEPVWTGNNSNEFSWNSRLTTHQTDKALGDN